MKDKAMRYVAVDWIHNLPSEPVRLYHELEADGYERRKVDEYRDGTLHSADASHGQGSTFLSWEPIPSLAEINSDTQFHAKEITEQEFERIWNRVKQPDLQLVGGS